MIENDEDLRVACQEMASSPVIGVDTESDSFYHYQEKVCLVQISTLEADYIIDPLQLRGLEPLAGLLEDPAVIKILHGADYDIVCMKRDFGISIRNIFDTMVAAQFLGFPRVGLADLIHRYFGIRPDKKYQRHDWSQRPLLEDHLQYARGDTHWLLAIHEVLLHRLSQADRLEAALEECALVEQREWTGRTSSDSDFLKLKGAGTLDIDGQRVLRKLWEYREGVAKRMDRPSFKAIPGDTLLHVAHRRPLDLDEMAECVRPSSTLFRQHGPPMVAAVKGGLDDPRPLPEPEAKAPRSGGSHRGAPNEALLTRLKAWRNQIVDSQRIAPVVVASNQLLKEVAIVQPTDLAELAGLDSVRTWQVKSWGGQILAIVAEGRRDSSPGTAKGRRRRRRRTGDPADGPGAESQGE